MEDEEMWCRMRRCLLVEKKVQDVVPSVIKGHALYLLLFQRGVGEVCGVWL